jgi:hypothetical protein
MSEDQSGLSDRILHNINRSFALFHAIENLTQKAVNENNARTKIRPNKQHKHTDLRQAHLKRRNSEFAERRIRLELLTAREIGAHPIFGVFHRTTACADVELETATKSVFAEPQHNALR